MLHGRATSHLLSSDCVSESNCSYAAAPQDGSCTDTCCMAHDKCCGCYGQDDLTICDPVSGKGQELCNTQFTDCLNNCKLLDSCHATDGSRWGPSIIKLAFGCVPWRLSPPLPLTPFF